MSNKNKLTNPPNKKSHKRIKLWEFPKKWIDNLTIEEIEWALFYAIADKFSIDFVSVQQCKITSQISGIIEFLTCSDFERFTNEFVNKSKSQLCLPHWKIVLSTKPKTRSTSKPKQLIDFKKPQPIEKSTVENAEKSEFDENLQIKEKSCTSNKIFMYQREEFIKLRESSVNLSFDAVKSMLPNDPIIHEVLQDIDANKTSE